jgi:ABC-type cobalamin transport system permease subunit
MLKLFNLYNLNTCLLQTLSVTIPGLLGTVTYVYPSVLNLLNESRERTSIKISGKCGISSEIHTKSMLNTLEK